MGEIFAFLGKAVEGAPLAALAAAFVWGVLSVLLPELPDGSYTLNVGTKGGRSSQYPMVTFPTGVPAKVVSAS